MNDDDRAAGLRCRYSIEQCDVEDKAALAEFRQKRDQWLDWLLTDEHHAIWDQINTMMWSDAMFRLVNEVRGQAIDDGGQYACLSGHLAHFIDAGYFANQLLSLRRLTEKRAQTPRRQIISLRRLLSEMKDHRNLFTREIYVSYDGSPYDFEPAKRAFYERLFETAVKNRERERVMAVGAPTHGPDAFSDAERNHENFDRLSGVVSGERSRSNVIREGVFKLLEEKLDAEPIERVTAFLNKKLAHAADPESMPETGIDPLTLNDIWLCQRTIIEVATFATILLAHGPDHGVVPMPQFGLLNEWAAPFAPADALSEVQRTWEEQNDERENWRLQGYDDIVSELTRLCADYYQDS